MTGFPRQARLLKPAEFKRVFQQPKKAFDNGFSILWLANGTGVARLGLAISKKNARRAVDRNRIKRLVRESFRRHRDRLPAVDAVVMIRHEILARTNSELSSSLERLWERLIRHG